jgi:hypothetical protein
MFVLTPPARGRQALRRVLRAYARRNPAVGYCQSMNFLAATCLLAMPEEDAFWVLAALVEDRLAGYYDRAMLEVQVGGGRGGQTTYF